ncbi:hypothetical protein HDZ31DRAFT_41059 [Schizophyllum fasciatum]
MTYTQQELAYEQGFRYQPGPASQASLAARSSHPLIPQGAHAAELAMAGGNTEMPFRFPQYPTNTESGFEMPSMDDYQLAMRNPSLMQGGSLDDTAHGVYALGTNMMSMCDGTSNSFDSAQWTQYLGLMVQDGVYNNNPGTTYPYGHVQEDPYRRRGPYMQ